jgi:hypothetical protein
LGTLERYGYETPWASAWLVAEPATLARHAAVSAFFDWVDSLPDDLPDAEIDRRYEHEQAARSLDDVLLDACRRGWEIRMPDGERRAIGPPRFEADGFVTWRW